MIKPFLKLIFLVLVISETVVPCTNLIVTKGATVDGSTMITYSADSYASFGYMCHYPSGKFPEGAMLDVYEWDTGKFLGKIKQASETYNVIGNINEYQVSIGETTFGGRTELEDTKGGVDYGSLIYIALQRSKTAREAIKIMTDIVAEYGYYSEGESFSIADPNEAWIMEMIGKGEGNKGAVWVAVKIPDGYVSAHANQARITKFSLKDKENTIYSSDVISFARAKGYFNGKDEDFSFSDTYNPLDFSGIRFCEARVWSLFRRINGGADKYLSYIKYESKERMPLYVKPDKKLSVRDVMSLMRDHYEGTELDMTKGIGAGPYASPYRYRPLEWKLEGKTYFHERPISTPQTAFSFVSQLRSNLPREIGGLMWFGVDDTYMTVYSPIYCCVSKVPYNFQGGIASLSQFNWNSAFWVFNFVANFTYPRYSVIIEDVQKEQTMLESKYISKQSDIEKEAQNIYKTSSASAVEYLENYSTKCATETYNHWKKLGEQLFVKYMDGADKNEFYKPVGKGYSDDFKRKIINEEPNKFLVKEEPYNLEEAYSECLRQATKMIKNKKFNEAVELYKKASEYKPNEQLPKEKIQKLEKIIKEMKEMENSLD